MLSQPAKARGRGADALPARVSEAGHEVLPTLLLDDPSAELDRERLDRFIERVKRLQTQLIVTALDRDFALFGAPMRCSTWNRGGSGQLEPNQTSFHVERLDAPQPGVSQSAEPMRRESCVHRRLLRQTESRFGGGIGVRSVARRGSLCLPHHAPRQKRPVTPRSLIRAHRPRPPPRRIVPGSLEGLGTPLADRLPSLPDRWLAGTYNASRRKAGNAAFYRRFKPMNSLIFLMRVRCRKRGLPPAIMPDRISGAPHGRQRRLRFQQNQGPEGLDAVETPGHVHR